MTESLCILVTGATGFVGREVCRQLGELGNCRVLAGVRSPEASVPDGAEIRVHGTIDGGTRWSSALDGVEVVIHCAARVHVMKDSGKDPLSAFRQTNVEGTLALAVPRLLPGFADLCLSAPSR